MVTGSAGALNGHLLHLTVRFAGESVLEGAGDGKAKTGQCALRTRDGFQVVPDFAGGGVEFEEEALFAFLDMHWGGDVDESKPGRLVCQFLNSA